MPPLSGSWANALKGEFSKDYYKKLFQTVGAEYKTHTIYPPADDIFNAFHFTPLEQVKVWSSWARIRTMSRDRRTGSAFL